MNTRKYPRTLNEAFPRGTEYAASIERTRRTDWSGFWIVSAVCAVAIFGPLIWKWVTL